ncbi:MAG: FAD-dependent oxidoreductase, partial [Candidatus Zixiibacteriota bacterium]
AVLLAMGAHQSKPLGLDNENIAGIYPSIEFLKAFNLRGEQLGRGRVGVIGGGNSAIDAARMALRQKDVESVTILYRRTRDEMPAFAEEIEGADQEGIEIKTLVTPVRVVAGDGRLKGIECVTNKLGDTDASGRRRPVPIEGTEHRIELDTLVVAIGEEPCLDGVGEDKSGIETTRSSTVEVDPATLAANRPGVFAAGDVVTGPNTVVDSIAAGKRAALMIDRFIRREELKQPEEPKLPRVYVEPMAAEEEEGPPAGRVETPRAPAAWRARNFSEVEVSLSVDEAMCEARRCLRCDLEYTRPKDADDRTETEAAAAARK